MLSEIEQLPAVKLHFRHKLQRANFDKGHLLFDVSGQTKEHSAKLVVGADGSYSKVRDQMMRVVRLAHQQHY